MGRSRGRRTAWALAAAYLVGLVVLLTGPWGLELNRLTVGLYTFFRYDWPVAPDWALPHHYGFVLNVVLFVPLGAVLVVLTRRPWWVATLLALLGSTAVEVAQGLWLDRVGSVADVVANTLGALVGALLLTPRRRRG
ncbi:VanZ family protein [Nocardioides zeicaulis]|uniref:VanZ family protein n=1 Tax=Nocardioides zeicaulis TaxID=1776857 RepID=A0ABV6DZT6_9ACTN